MLKNRNGWRLEEGRKKWILRPSPVFLSAAFLTSSSSPKKVGGGSDLTLLLYMQINMYVISDVLRRKPNPLTSDD